MAIELPEALHGTYPDVTRAVRKIYAAMKSGQDLASACGALAPLDARPGSVVVTGPERLTRGKVLFRPHLLHDVASARTGGRELQTWLVDPLLELSWGGLCLVTFPKLPTFCRVPSTLLMVVSAAGVPVDQIQRAAFSGSSDMRALFEQAHANLCAEPESL